MDVKIIIKKVDELPDYVKNNDVEYWDYPIEELDELLEQIEDGDRENNSTFLLYNNRLYEC